MSATVLTNQSLSYPGDDQYAVYDNLVAVNLYALRDSDTNAAQDLYLGASKDVKIQGLEGMSMWLGSSNSLAIMDKDSNASLIVTTDATTTTLSSEAKNLVIGTSNNAVSTIQVGATVISESNNFQVFSTNMSSGFLLQNPLKVSNYGIFEQSLSVGGNIVCNSNLFTQNYNLFKYNSSNELNAVVTGYAFTINESDQLELLKYTSFSNGTKVSKRVGIFGLNKYSDSEQSDKSYAAFDTIGTVSQGGDAVNFSSTVADNSITTAKIVDGCVTSTKLGSNVGVFSVNTSNIYFTTDSNLSSGSVGIGTSTPQYKLDVSGEIRATGDITGFSDRRIKTDIEVIDHALDKVLAISGYTFKRIGSNKRSTGVIAQEVQSVLPEAVNVDAEGMLSVAYGNLAGLLIQAIHDLNDKIERRT